MNVTFSRRAWKTVYYHLKLKVPGVDWYKFPDPLRSSPEERTFSSKWAYIFTDIWQTRTYRHPEFSKFELIFKYTDDGCYVYCQHK